MAHNTKTTLNTTLNTFGSHRSILLFIFLPLLLFLLLPSPSDQNPAPSHREKRQTFDFSMNTPRPTETNVSSSNGVPDPPPLPNTGGLGSALGGLFGSSDTETENNTASNPNTGRGDTDQPENAGTSSNGSTGSSFDGSGLPFGNAPHTSGGNSSGDVPGLGGSGWPFGDQSGNADTNSTSSPNGGGLDLGSLFGDGGSDNSSAGGSGCKSLEALACQMHSCANGGQCHVLNNPTCTPQCQCFPPYDDTKLYDERCRRRTDTVNNTTSPTPTSSPLNADCGLRCYRGECRFTTASRTSMYCYCEPGYVGHFCDTPCGRNCSNNGTCDVDERRGAEICVCPDPWVGPYCTQLPPEEDDSWVYWLVGCLAVGLVLVMIAAALVIYCLWKKRLVFAMKVVYYFKSYEDNDGLQYDAFVSYVSRPEDEDFVYKQLRPKLEQEMGFRLCLHQRDFVIGETISNNICDTLEDSRRFILVLTPRYLESEWAEFEYQKAFHEMLKLKMRIVPIILEEITSTSTINPTLRAILDSVTYITYPGCGATQQQMDKFWKRVHLSMPKTKNKESSKELEILKSSYVKSLDGDVVENGKPSEMMSIESKEMEALKLANGNGLSCTVENEELSDTKNNGGKGLKPLYATLSTGGIENGKPSQMDPQREMDSSKSTEINFPPAANESGTLQTGLGSPSENTDSLSGVVYDTPEESAEDIATSPAVELNHVRVDLPNSEGSAEDGVDSSTGADDLMPTETEIVVDSSEAEKTPVSPKEDKSVLSSPDASLTKTTLTEGSKTKSDTTNNKLNAKSITSGNVFTKLFSSKTDDAETVKLEGYRPLEDSLLAQLSESKDSKGLQNGLYANGTVNEAFDG